MLYYKTARSIILVSATYVAAQILADLTALKIILFAGLSMSGGTLIYPITFTLRDMVHKATGKRNAQILIIAAGAINLFMAGFFWLIAALPGDPHAGDQSAFGAVLAPVWRIVVASIIAEVLSELADTEIYHLWISKVTRRYQWSRVLFSNAVSVPIDSLVFCWLAFGGVLPNFVVWSIIGSQILVKGVFTIVGLPLIYTIEGEA